MTDMYRLTVSIPDELLAALENFKAEHLANEPLSEVIRVLVRVGLDTEAERKA